MNPHPATPSDPGSPAPAGRAGSVDAAAPSDSSAADLLPVVYEELRRLARARLAREPGGPLGQTLQPTALVHEAYLRIVGSGRDGGAPVQWSGPGHFFGAAALAMRRILVERARERGQLKRGGGRDREQLPLSHVEAGDPADQVDLLALDDALTALELEDPRKSQIVSLRYFAGLTLEQAADVTGQSLATVKRDWSYARAWLLDRISGAGGATGDGGGVEPGA
jgi:RNA polymerase sigma factor (TIGR02999 family)